MYEEKFEQNTYVNFHDLWEYISKKLQSEGENSAKILSESNYTQQYMKQLVEVDEAQAAV